MWRGISAFLTVVVVAGTASAQSAPPVPAPAPTPPPMYPQQAQSAPALFRLTLTDGRVIDVQIIGSDTANLYIREAGRDYTLARAQIVSSVPLTSSPSPIPPTESPKKYDSHERRSSGWALFLSSYVATATVVLLRVKDDSSAVIGLLPVLGPVLWSGTGDDDAFGTDGWDWLAIVDSLAQAGGAWWILTANDPANPRAVTLTPRAHRNFQGLLLQGHF